MTLIDFTYLAKLLYVSLRILKNFTMEDGQHTHYMGVYSKIFTSIKECVNASNRSLEDGPSLVTKVLPSISLVVPGHFCRFYRQRRRERGQ